MDFPELNEADSAKMIEMGNAITNMLRSKFSEDRTAIALWALAASTTALARHIGVTEEEAPGFIDDQKKMLALTMAASFINKPEVSS